MGAAGLWGQGHRSHLAPEAVAEACSVLTVGGLAEAGDAGRGGDAGGPDGATREPAREAGRRSCRAAASGSTGSGGSVSAGPAPGPRTWRSLTTTRREGAWQLTRL